MTKWILVTGGTKGIGKAIIEKFASEGFNVATCARSESDLQKLQTNLEAAFSVRVIALKADVSDKNDLKRFLETVKAKISHLDVVVNNAGFFIPGAIHEEGEGTLEAMIETNLYSAYRTTRAFISEMKNKRKGHIFNICSTASIMPYVNGGSYCISKFALLGMSKVLREEMKTFNVRVTAVLPGATLTASWEGAELSEERFMKSKDVAEAVWSAYQMSDRTVIEELIMRPQLGDI
ncbi:MAG: SDR family oxidoreductase [Bacteroidota bacterium]